MLKLKFAIESRILRHIINRVKFTIEIEERFKFCSKQSRWEELMNIDLWKFEFTRWLGICRLLHPVHRVRDHNVI